MNNFFHDYKAKDEFNTRDFFTPPSVQNRYMEGFSNNNNRQYRQNRNYNSNNHGNNYNFNNGNGYIKGWNKTSINIEDLALPVARENHHFQDIARAITTIMVPPMAIQGVVPPVRFNIRQALIFHPMLETTTSVLVVIF